MKARKAVGVLQQMPAYKQVPTESHYTAAIRACELSSQFQLALSVYEEMCDLDVYRSQATYEALISVAEKTNHTDEVFRLFDRMREEGVVASTGILNACLWAASKETNVTLSLEIFETMTHNGIPCNEETYTAILSACDNAADGKLALRLYDKMVLDDLIISVEMYQYILWACVKSGMHDEALSLFDRLEAAQFPLDTECFNAAIWACELDGPRLHTRVTHLLRLMKFNGLSRNTKSFNGAISAFLRAGQYDECLEGYKSMDYEMPPAERDELSYELLVIALDAAGRHQDALETYQLAFRKGHFNPWVNQTRLMDVSEFHPAIVRTALMNVFNLIRTGKLSLFNLNIVIGPEEGSNFTPHLGIESNNLESHQLHEDFSYQYRRVNEHNERMDDVVVAFLRNISSLSSSDESSSLSLACERKSIDGRLRLIISRDALAVWKDG